MINPTSNTSEKAKRALLEARSLLTFQETCTQRIRMVSNKTILLNLFYFLTNIGSLGRKLFEHERIPSTLNSADIEQATPCVIHNKNEMYKHYDNTMNVDIEGTRSRSRCRQLHGSIDNLSTKDIEGAQPKKHVKDLNKPSFSLMSNDVPGAQPRLHNKNMTSQNKPPKKP